MAKYSIIFLIATLAVLIAVDAIEYQTSLRGFCWSQMRMEPPEEELVRCAFSGVIELDQKGVGEKKGYLTDFDEARKISEAQGGRFYRIEWGLPENTPQFKRVILWVPTKTGSIRMDSRYVDRCRVAIGGSEEDANAPWKCGRLIQGTNQK